MKKRLLVAGLAAVALSATSIATAGTTLHLTAKDNHKTFFVKKHNTVVITLKSPGFDGGYQWKRGPVSAVKFISMREVSKKIPGCKGIPCRRVSDAFRFTVVGPSRGEIQLRYVSPGRKIVKHFGVGLRVG